MVQEITMKIIVVGRKASFSSDMEHIEEKRQVWGARREYLEKKVIQAKEQLKQKEMKTMDESKRKVEE